MKVYQLLIATLALGASAMPNPEADQDIAARSPAENNLVARTFWNKKKCGWGAIYKHGKCYCFWKNCGYEHNQCVVKCHESAYYEHGQCKCDDGYTYDEHYGCQKDEHY